MIPSIEIYESGEWFYKGRSAKRPDKEHLYIIVDANTPIGTIVNFIGGAKASEVLGEFLYDCN